MLTASTEGGEKAKAKEKGHTTDSKMNTARVRHDTETVMIFNTTETGLTTMPMATTKEKGRVAEKEKVVAPITRAETGHQKKPAAIVQFQVTMPETAEKDKMTSKARHRQQLNAPKT